MQTFTEIKCIKYFILERKKHDISETMKVFLKELLYNVEKWLEGNLSNHIKFIESTDNPANTAEYIMLKIVSRECKNLFYKYGNEMNEDDMKSYENYINEIKKDIN
jgi:hypothetical protein